MWHNNIKWEKGRQFPKPSKTPHQQILKPFFSFFSFFFWRGGLSKQARWPTYFSSCPHLKNIGAFLPFLCGHLCSEWKNEKWLLFNNGLLLQKKRDGENTRAGDRARACFEIESTRDKTNFLPPASYYYGRAKLIRASQDDFTWRCVVGFQDYWAISCRPNSLLRRGLWNGAISGTLWYHAWSDTSNPGSFLWPSLDEEINPFIVIPFVSILTSLEQWQWQKGNFVGAGIFTKITPSLPP